MPMTPDFFPDMEKIVTSISRILEVNPEDVLDLAGTTKTTATQLLDDADFKRLQLDNSMLGGFPTGQAVVSAHGTAHQVVLETLNGVHQDLLDFAGYLEKAVSGLGDADDLSASALDQLAQVQFGSKGDQARHDAQQLYVPPADS